MPLENKAETQCEERIHSICRHVARITCREDIEDPPKRFRGTQKSNVLFTNPASSFCERGVRIVDHGTAEETSLYLGNGTA